VPPAAPTARKSTLSIPWRPPFIAAYTIQPDRIVILALYHGAQKWPDAF